jgi:RNA-directed DNA polymerase
MVLIRFLRRLLGLEKDPVPSSAAPVEVRVTAPPTWTRNGRPRLTPLRYQSSLVRTESRSELCLNGSPYRFAHLSVDGNGHLDLSRDGDPRWLRHFGLPELKTPEELADFFDLKLGKLAWLTHRFDTGKRPAREVDAHYHFRWLLKRGGGYRLIESPKSTLKQTQLRILREILDRVPAHRAAHGFVKGRSVRTNALPHVGRRVVLKFDLENFYASVRYSRVVAIFRSLGYSREAALWLARLTTSVIPAGISLPPQDAGAVRVYYPRHLPQGAPTSPALANLSAFGLDVRLAGLAQAFDAGYTRYADDLTFSAHGRFIPALRDFIPLVTQIIREERFAIHKSKRKVIRNNQRQVVTGVVVNVKPNVSRVQFDQLKAILHNCVRHGPTSQNRAGHPDFAAHLLGRIAQMTHLNPARGVKLRALYDRIDWQTRHTDR